MTTMPSVFIGLGSPMVALQEDPYHQNVADFFKAFPKPVGIVVVSPNWKTAGPAQVTVSAKPGILHDFRGFPPELFEIEYGAPGSPELALKVVSLLAAEKVSATLNPDRPLDFGAWIPLRIAYPAADVPVVQVSLPMVRDAGDLLRMGKALRDLRKEGILILGTGGTVYNMNEIRWAEKEGPAFDWATRFDEWVLERLKVADVQALLEFEEESADASRAHPSREHFFPLLFTLGASLPQDRLAVIHQGFQYRSLSMFSFALVGPSADLHGASPDDTLH